MMQVDVQENENGNGSLLVIGYLKQQYEGSNLLHDKQSAIINLIQLFSGSDHKIKQMYDDDDEDKFNKNGQTEEKKELEPEPTPTPEPMDIIPETIKSKSLSVNRITREKKSMEQTVLLVDGYIREQSLILKLSITIVISDIIQQFYKKMK